MEQQTNNQNLTLEEYLRECFAAAALQALAGDYAPRGDINVQAKEHAQKIAAHCYNIADAMLAERSRRK